MADVAYDPTATGLANGAGWANAYTTLQAAETGAGAGGRVFARNSNGANAETYTVNSPQTLASPGTLYAPVLVYACKNATTNFPPIDTDLVVDENDADVSVFDNSSGGGSADVRFTGAAIYRGFKLLSGGDFEDGAVDTFLLLDKCVIDWGGVISSNRYLRAQNYGSRILLNECTLANLGSGDKLSVNNSGVIKVHSSKTTGAGGSGDLVITPNVEGIIDLSDTDLSSLTGLSAAFRGGGRGVAGKLYNCRMWAGWSLVSGTVNDTEQYEAINCDTAADHASPALAYRSESYLGSVAEEKTIVHAGDVGDGSTPFSYKLTPHANGPVEGLIPLYSPWIPVHVDTTSTQIEVYVYNTGSDKNNGEVWLEVLSPNETVGASISPRVHKSTRVAALATPATLTDDTTLWAGTANFSQKMSIAVAPDTDGIAHVRVAYAMRSATPDDLYVSPEPVVT